MEYVESDLVAAHKATTKGAEALKLAEEEKETVCAEAVKLREEGRTVEAKRKEAEQENAQLTKEMEELWVGFMAHKKKIEELRARFAAQKKELETEYQKQVDELYLFGYRCCMKKNDITQDIPSLPSDDEDEAPSSSS